MKTFILVILLIPTFAYASAVSDFESKSRAKMDRSVLKTPPVTGPVYRKGTVVAGGENPIIKNYSRKLDENYKKSLENVERSRQRRESRKSDM